MVYAGVDLGQRRDHTAIAVVERLELCRAPVMQSVLLRYLERVPLGTPYPEIVARLKELVREAGRAGGGCSVAVDATGVGAPVVDMLRGAGLGCEVTAVVMTGGEGENSRGGVRCVPKLDLVAGVQVLLERGELKIARGMKQAGALVRELVDVKARLGGSGRVRVGADGAGEHDDLVMAVALACWRARRRGVGEVGMRLTGI